MRKTIKVLQVLSYIDDLHMNYDELEKVIEELEMSLDSKSDENE